MIHALRPRLTTFAAVLALLLLAAPFAGLVVATDWRHLGFAHGDAGAVAVSLGLSLVALLLIALLGTPLAWWLARHRVRGQWLIDALLLLALLTPPRRGH